MGDMVIFILQNSNQTRARIWINYRKITSRTSLWEIMFMNAVAFTSQQTQPMWLKGITFMNAVAFTTLQTQPMWLREITFMNAVAFTTLQNQLMLLSRFTITRHCAHRWNGLCAIFPSEPQKKLSESFWCVLVAWFILLFVIPLRVNESQYVSTALNVCILLLFWHCQAESPTLLTGCRQ